MIKRTLYFGNPAYLSTTDEQLCIYLPSSKTKKQTPIEDLGVVILDHQHITITHCVLEKLLDNNVALITCNKQHHPTGMMLNLDGHSLQSQKFQYQINASLPLKKKLWQQTIKAKIYNQAKILEQQDYDASQLYNMSQNVKTGDKDNMEARASVLYWKLIFPEDYDFRRERFGYVPNNYLNYGYAILRAIVARSLVGSGLLPTLGIFHRNQYNAYCLADDIMEPYRPYVDDLVLAYLKTNDLQEELSKQCKQHLLQIPVMDVIIDGVKSPLMNAVQRTTASLAKCFEGKSKELVYPLIE